MSVTQRDIAKALGISHSTVSRALVGSPKISEERRAEIIHAAVKMGYVANPSATALAQCKKNSKSKPIHASIAWLNAWSASEQLFQYSEFRLYWDGAKETTLRHGYHLEEFFINQEMPASRVQQILHARGIQGVLIPPHSDGSAVFEEIDWSQFAVVRFGRSVKCPAVNLVSSDQVKNVIMSYHEIQNRGYKRIGFVDGNSIYHHFAAGFLWAQKQSGHDGHIPIFSPQSDDPNNQTMFERWLSEYQPDAILTQVGEISNMLEIAGLRVGVDIAVAANSVLDGGISAGIYQNSKEIGSVAALSLIAQIQDHQYGIPELYRETLIGGKWVDGDTLKIRV
jgi:LacI family transcriptional regulator